MIYPERNWPNIGQCLNFQNYKKTFQINFCITESIFNGTQAFTNPTDLASSGIWKNGFLSKTPGFNGV